MKGPSPAGGTDTGRSPLRLLAALAQSNYPLSLDDMMRENGMTLAAAQRALRLLCDEGFATVDPDSGHYVVGSKFLRLAQFARGNHLLDQKIRPVMRELALAAGETVTFNTYEPGATFALCVMVEESPSPLHYVVEVGERKPLHAGSSGKAILAHLPDRVIEAYIEQTGLPPVTSRTITDARKLWREIRRVRKQGYTISRGQRLEGAVAVAGSVFGAYGEIHASLVITIPAHRYRVADPERIATLVMDAAHRITELMNPRAGR